MDDFVLIHQDKDKLKEALKIIEEKLNKEYKLKLNKKKTKIVRENEGFSFLGYTYKVINNKTIIKIKKEALEKIKKRVKDLNYKYQNERIGIDTVFSSLMTYWNNRKYGNQMKVRRIINKYWFLKRNI